MKPELYGSGPYGHQYRRCLGVTASGRQCGHLLWRNATTSMCSQHSDQEGTPPAVYETEQERSIACARHRLDPGPLPLDGAA